MKGELGAGARGAGRGYRPGVGRCGGAGGSLGGTVRFPLGALHHNGSFGSSDGAGPVFSAPKRLARAGATYSASVARLGLVYARRVLADAMRATLAWSRQTALLLTLVLGAASIGLLWRWRGGPVRDPLMAAVLPAVAVLLLVFLGNLLTAPVRLDSALRGELATTERALDQFHRTDFDIEVNRFETPISYNLGVYVHNRGPSSDFQAQVMSVSGCAEPPTALPFSVLWDTTTDKRCPVQRGGSERLTFASVTKVAFRDDDPECVNCVIDLHLYGAGNESRKAVLSRAGESTLSRRALVRLRVFSIDPEGQREWDIAIGFQRNGQPRLVVDEGKPRTL